MDYRIKVGIILDLHPSERPELILNDVMQLIRESLQRTPLLAAKVADLRPLEMAEIEPMVRLAPFREPMTQLPLRCVCGHSYSKHAPHSKHAVEVVGVCAGADSGPYCKCEKFEEAER